MSLDNATRMQFITPFYVMELLQRAQQLQQQGMDIIHMEIGEPDFPTPPLVVAAAQRSLLENDIKYTAAAGLPELRQAIANYYQQFYGVSVDWRRIFVTPGASGALLLAFGSSINPGQQVMMADPCYPCNANFLEIFNAQAQLVAVDAACDYQLHVDLLQQAWQVNTRGVLIASPSNPTGTVIADQVLQALIQATLARDGIFYADEIYHGLNYAAPLQTALAYSDKVFVVNSFSKFFGMTGWRIGWLVVPENFIDAVERLAQNVYLATSTLSQYAALAALSLQNRQELLARRDQFQQRRDFLYDGLSRLGFSIPLKPQGAFYIYADCSAFTDDSFRFAKDLLEQTGVAVTPGKDFGYNACNNHLRFAYTASTDKMAVALTRLEEFLCR